MSYGSEAAPGTGESGRTYGREPQLQLLERVLEATAAGQFGAIVIEGEPGIGKSHLLKVCVRRATAAGFWVLEGRCEELARHWRLHGILDALRHADPDPSAEPLWADGALLQPSDAGQVGASGKMRTDVLDQRATEIVFDLIESVAIARPVLLSLDDVQWADLSTLRVLAGLISRLRHHPVLVVVAGQVEAHRPELERVLGVALAHGAVHVRLGSIDPAAAVALTEDLVGAPPGELLIEQVAAAGGNPLFVSQLVRALSDEGAIITVDGCADVCAVSLPPSLRLVVIRRLASLPEPTVEVLQAAAILGRRFSIQHLALVLDKRPAELLPLLQPALRTSVISEHGDRLGFRHDLVRSAVYEDLPLGFRQVLHAHVAHVLDDAGAPAHEVFEHVSLGATEGDPAAVQWMQDAAAVATLTSPSLAVRFLDRAAEVAGGRGTLGQIVRLRLIEALTASGELNRGEALARSLLDERLDPPTTRLAQSALGQALFQRGEFADAMDTLTQVAEHADDPVEGARALSLAALSATFVGAVDADHRIAQSISRAEELDDVLAAAYSHTARAERARMTGYLRAAADAGRRAGEFAKLVWSDPSLPPIPVPAGHVLAAGELAEAEGILHSRYWGETGSMAGYQPVRHMFLSILHYWRGDWEQAKTEAETTIALAEEAGTSWGPAPAVNILCRLAVHRNQPVEAERHAQALLGRYELVSAVSTALVLELRSDPRDLRRHLQEVGPKLLDTVESLALSPSDAGTLVRLCVSTGQEQLACQIMDLMERFAARADVAWATAQALWARGLVDGDAERLLAAAEMFGSSSMAPAAANALEGAASALFSSDRRSDAVTALTQAADTYRRIDATRDHARVVRSLREMGVRHRGISRATPRTGWSALTTSEMEIAELIRQGLTYREIGEIRYVSKRTVETHAVHIFQKLGVSGRKQLERLPEVPN